MSPPARVRAGGPRPGAGLVVAGRAGTAVFCAATAAGVVWPDRAGPVAQAVALVLFAAGCVAFGRAYVVAVGRSRNEQVSTLAAFLRMPGAPPALRAEFRVATGLQFAAGLAGAALRPFGVLAFGILAGVYGLGLIGLWGASFGEFPPRRQAGGRKRHG